MEPVFRRKKCGSLVLSDTGEALAVRAERRDLDYKKANSASNVRIAADNAVERLGGDMSNREHLLGQFTFQFGIYRYVCEIFTVTLFP
jgi:hypothetical protein